uniref:Cyclin N-terminal domain-containing protein n=1 Tax=Kalanchoe fedtschenkoi TaxID=63787 RepID=A0A7N0ZWL3_KALFE
MVSTQEIQRRFVSCLSLSAAIATELQSNGFRAGSLPLFCDEPQWSNDDEVDETDDGAGRASLVVVSEEELAALLARRRSRSRRRWVWRKMSRLGLGLVSRQTRGCGVDDESGGASLFLRRHNRPRRGLVRQLTDVTCLSLAAEVEETQSPLLLDLQVEGAKFVFEPKMIQSMELLVLSTLQWRMHPVTPLSLIDHVTRRLRAQTPSPS